MMDALDKATVAKLRECAAMLRRTADCVIRIGGNRAAGEYRTLAASAESLADDIEKAEAGK